MADQAEITRHSHPLGRIVICCTSVPPESRQALAKKAQDMGARHVLDLTSDVTHLVCGDITTPKYKYVAKMRTDVKVMKVEWVDAMYDSWIDGEDINPGDFEKEFKLPILYGLSISVTGILDVADRKKIEQLVVDQEATYHPDLTRHVTHLIAAAPTGNKYDFARGNGISVVAVQWLYDSLERGMALGESYYDPKLPKEKIGVGARPAPASDVSPVEVVAEVRGKRKIRKRAEDMLGSQSQNIWGDILKQASNPKAKKKDEWEESSRTNNVKKTRDISGAEAKHGPNKVETQAGIWANVSFYIHGYSKKKGDTIKNVLGSHDGKITHSLQDLKSFQDSSRLFVVVPHDLHKRDCPDISNTSDISLVTEWWIEACMHKRRFIEPSEGYLYSPFDEFPLEGFESLVICLTRFSGIELLHMSRLINLLGGCFHDYLTKKTHLLVTDLPIGGEKFDFAVQNNIPVVTAEWFQECLKQSRGVPFTDFLVKGQTQRRIEDPGNSKRPMDTGDSGDNKRPRFSGINLGGGKLLGENLQSFGDRLRGKVPGGKTGADADAKTSGPLSNNRDIQELVDDNGGEFIRRNVSVQVGKTRQDGKKGGILDGCVICVSGKLKASSVELNSIARNLGATVVDSFSTNDMIPITHLIHSSNTSRDTTEDFKAASTIRGCHIVSPSWLYMCGKSKKMVDENIYPSIAEPNRGLEMDFTDSSSSLSPVNTMDLQMPSEPKFKVERKGPNVNEEDEAGLLPQDEGNDNNLDLDINYQPRNIEPTPPMSVSVPTAFLQSNTNRQSFPVQGASTDNRGTLGPPEASDGKPPAIGNILGKLGKGELTTAMDKRRRPRGKLQGKATSNLSSFSRASSVSSSRADSVPPSQQGVTDPKDKITNMPDKKHEVELPAPSQAIRYEDPEVEKERKSVRAKLSGDAFPAETPKPTKVAAKRTKMAVDVEGSASTRKTKRSK